MESALAAPRPRRAFLLQPDNEPAQKHAYHAGFVGSRTIVAVIAGGVAPFLAGFSISSRSHPAAGAPPIVNPHAWKARAAAVRPVAAELTRKATTPAIRGKCPNV